MFKIFHELKFAMKIFSLFLILLSTTIFSCTPLLHLNKIQSDRRIKKTEAQNFTGLKAVTQWWYYDCVFEDGSVLVFLFTPYQWWSTEEKKSINKSLFYFSYMNSLGEVISSRKVFDVAEIQYDVNSIKASSFEIIKDHEKNSRNYLINFFLDSLKGTLKITSSEKGFSPFPRGSMSSTIASIFKHKSKGVAIRYAAHIPGGSAQFNIEFKDSVIELKGCAYHEQGWFTGTPDQMGSGWTWFHFVSKNINIFGTAGQFLYLEKKDVFQIGGLTKKCSLNETTYLKEKNNLLIGGKLTFNSKKLSFSLTPTGKPPTPLIFMPSFDTNQLWGTVLQETTINFMNKKTELNEGGILFLETCRMR